MIRSLEQVLGIIHRAIEDPSFASSEAARKEIPSMEQEALLFDLLDETLVASKRSLHATPLPHTSSSTFRWVGVFDSQFSFSAHSLSLSLSLIPPFLLVRFDFPFFFLHRCDVSFSR